MTEDQYDDFAEALSKFVEQVKEKTGHEFLILWGASEGDVHVGGSYVTKNMEWDVAAKLAVSCVGGLHVFYGVGGHE